MNSENNEYKGIRKFIAVLSWLIYGVGFIALSKAVVNKEGIESLASASFFVMATFCAAMCWLSYAFLWSKK